MTMITPSYLGETIEYSSLHACRSTLEDPTQCEQRSTARVVIQVRSNIEMDVWGNVREGTCAVASLQPAKNAT